MSLTYNKWNGLPLVIFGCGGAAKEAKAIIDGINSVGNVKAFDFLGFVGENEEAVNELVEGAPVVCCDGTFAGFAEKFHVLGVALPFEKPAIKREILERLQGINNLVYPRIIHPRAVIAESAGTEIGEGVIIGANAVIDPCVRLGNFVFINIASTIGHDSVIGDLTTVHISANISGCCVIGEDCIIGTNASVKQGVSVGNSAVCGMGAVVVGDVSAWSVVVSGKAKER